jgi:hypothetical protein
MLRNHPVRLPQQEIIDLPSSDWRTVEPEPPKPDPWEAAESLIVWVVTVAVLGLAGIGLQSMLYPPKPATCGKTSTGVHWCITNEPR